MERGQEALAYKDVSKKEDKLQLTAGQLKVMQNKYLKGDTPEVWLRGVAHNIALAEVLYSGMDDDHILRDVYYERKNYENGITSLLLHKKGSTYNERGENFKQYLTNLEAIVGRGDHFEGRENLSKFASLEVSAAKRVSDAETKFYWLLSNFYFLPNSPTLMNAGRKLQQLSACYVLPVEDSIEGWMKTAMDAAIIHKTGGGTGFAVSRVRPTGDSVQSTKGIASGPLSPLRIINTMTEEIKQGGQRRGANMGILYYKHPNIEDFIKLKAENPPKDGKPGELENLNVSLAIDEEFIAAVRENKAIGLVNPKDNKIVGYKNAKELFDLIIKCAWMCGDPGYVMIDRINNSTSNPTPKLGQIESTNPCVIGSTLVPTEFGLVRMKDLIKRFSEGNLDIVTDNRVPIKIMNRDGTIMLMKLEQSGVSINKISQAFSSGIKEVYKLITNNGYELTATQDHKIMTTEGWVELKDCLNKTILLQCREGKFNINNRIPLNVIDGQHRRLNLPTKWSKELGLVMGWLIGDGWLRSGDKNCRVGFTFSQADKRIMNLLKPTINKWYSRDIKEVQRENGVYHLSYHSKSFVDFFEKLGVKNIGGDKKIVPETIYTAPKEAVTGFLQGLFSADGTINVDKKNGNYYVRLTSKSIDLLKGVQVLLLNLGILSNLYDRSRKPNEKFEYKGKKYYSDGILYELNISREDIYTFFKEVGFLYRHKEKIREILNHDFRKREFEDKVVEIIYAGKEEVYDLTEPVTHSFLSNGIVVSNCGEQPLLPYEPCNLGSINLSKMVKDGEVNYGLLEEVVKTSTWFLDNVIDVNNYPIPEIEEIAKGNRRIGLGVMGWAEMLVKLGISYDSKEAFETAEKVMKFINEKSLEASESLAKERGLFPNYKDCIYDPDSQYFKGHEAKPRNCARTTIAPTGTIALAAGLKGSGIEPFFGICYERYQAEGVDALKKGLKPDQKYVYFEVVPEFLEYGERHGWFGLNRETVLKKISDNGGSLKGLEEIPESIQRLFQCAPDLSYKSHIDIQVAFQRYTDNAVSKTINMPNSATIEDIAAAYLYAYDKGVKGLTVYRDGSKSIQVLQSSKEKKAEENLENKIRNVRKRPQSLIATESKVPTPFGDVFVSYGFDEKGLRETFVKIGKAGEDVNALSEALGRVISTGLKYNVPPEEFIEQLRGIGGSGSVGFGKDKILSIPDAIAKKMIDVLEHEGPVLVETYKKLYCEKKELAQTEKSSNGNSNGHKNKQSLDFCPECRLATLYRAEGCEKCYNCEYQKC